MLIIQEKIRKINQKLGARNWSLHARVASLLPGKNTSNPRSGFTNVLKHTNDEQRKLG